MMKDKIESCYERLQSLDIVPTVSNMEKLLKSLYDLREVYQELCKDGENDGGEKADSE